MIIPFRETWLLTIGFALLVLMLYCFIRFFYKRFINLFRKTDPSKKSDSCIGCLIKFFLLNTFVVFSIVLVAFAIYIQTFNSFTNEKVVSEIVCEKVTNSNSLKFTMIGKEKEHQHLNFNDSFPADEWFLEGHILKWNSWGDAMGLPMMYRITKIGGNTYNSKSQSEVSFVKNFVSDETHLLWNLLYDLGSYFPLIGQIIPYYEIKSPEKDKIFRVYINSVNFEIKTIDRL